MSEPVAWSCPECKHIWGPDVLKHHRGENEDLLKVRESSSGSRLYKVSCRTTNADGSIRVAMRPVSSFPLKLDEEKPQSVKAGTPVNIVLGGEVNTRGILRPYFVERIEFPWNEDVVRITAVPAELKAAAAEESPEDARFLERIRRLFPEIHRISEEYKYRNYLSRKAAI